MLGGDLAVLQAPMFDGLSLDPFSLFDDGAGPAEVGVSGCHVAQAFVVTPVIVVFDEGLDLGLKVAGQEVVFQQDAVLHGLVPALDLVLPHPPKQSQILVKTFPMTASSAWTKWRECIELPT